MDNKTFKIVVLTWFILVFMFPLATFADLTADIAAWLTGRGCAVRETGELAVLVPDSDVTFEVKNADRLAKGWNTLRLDLFTGETLYAQTELKVFLESVPESAAAPRQDRSAKPQAAKTAVVKPGDQVNILFRSGGLIIKSNGKILRSAGLGETVDVLNVAFNTVVKAVVADSKNVILK